MKSCIDHKAGGVGHGLVNKCGAKHVLHLDDTVMVLGCTLIPAVEVGVEIKSQHTSLLIVSLVWRLVMVRSTNGLKNTN